MPQPAQGGQPAGGQPGFDQYGRPIPTMPQPAQGDQPAGGQFDQYGRPITVVPVPVIPDVPVPVAAPVPDPGPAVPDLTPEVFVARMDPVKKNVCKGMIENHMDFDEIAKF